MLVEVHAVSINPLDSKIRMGGLKIMLQYDMPLILGNDFSGIITEVGKGVTKFKVGDEVYGRTCSETREVIFVTPHPWTGWEHENAEW